MADDGVRRFRCIACEIMARELCYCVARSPNAVDLAFVTKALHDIPTAEMRDRLQREIDASDEGKYDAVLLAYGLCNLGTVGLRARSLPVVIPRAHDCITFLFGSKERYQTYFDRNPGTYYYSPGWLERRTGRLEDLSDQRIMHRLGLDKTYQEYVELYGEENARAIIEALGGEDKRRHYTRTTYVQMGPVHRPEFEREARRLAEKAGHIFEVVPGDLSLMRRLVDGEWGPDDFLVVEPGGVLDASYDASIVSTRNADGDGRGGS